MIIYKKVLVFCAYSQSTKHKKTEGVLAMNYVTALVYIQ